MSLIFKIVGAEEWRAAEADGVFRGSAVDLADGYMHFSTADQASATAAKWYAGRSDLRLIAADAEALGEALRWETARGGALFPHLYAALSMSAVRWRRDLPIGDDGLHQFGRLEG